MSESAVGPNVPAVEEAGEKLGEEQRTSHEADVAAGYEDDDAQVSGTEDALDAGADTSHEDDIRAGYDDPSDSPVGDDADRGGNRA